jgi:tRNA(Ile)-lysidine synthase
LLLPGKAVRGGGRASSTHPDEKALAIEIERLRPLHPALRRRILRAAVERLGASASFAQTELLLAMCEGKAGRRETLTAQLRAERTPRELRLIQGESSSSVTELPEYEVPVPGEVVAEAFRLRLILTIDEGKVLDEIPPAKLRSHRAGDRVRLRYSHTPKRMKEVLERMQIPANQRRQWPVLEWKGEIVWMPGAELENKAAAVSGLRVEAIEL